MVNLYNDVEMQNLDQFGMNVSFQQNTWPLIDMSCTLI